MKRKEKKNKRRDNSNWHWESDFDGGKKTKMHEGKNRKKVREALRVGNYEEVHESI
jgi:hypothetical protein